MHKDEKLRRETLSIIEEMLREAEGKGLLPDQIKKK